LTSLVVSLQAQNQMLTDQLGGAALAIVRDVKNGMSSPDSGNHVDLTGNIRPSGEALSSLLSRFEILKANLALVKGQTKSLGTIKAFSGIIPNIQCVKDVEAWLTTAFCSVDQDGEPYHEDRVVGE
jgi:hypothetical protein